MNKRMLVVAMLAALGTGTSVPALSQTTNATDSDLLEEVIVTATKREQSIYEVPIAVSAFTEDVMFRQGIVDLTDIGKFVPNMTVTGFSAGHTSSVNVFIRGDAFAAMSKSKTAIRQAKTRTSY